MTAVMIGVDPAKRSHAMAVLDGNENEHAVLQVRSDNDGYREMLRLAKRWKQRTWAVEGAGGVGVQLIDTGHGRKNDPGDAKTVAVVALRTNGLRQVVLDDERLALRLMSERRRELVQSRTKTVNYLHQLLMELLPAGAEPKLTASKAKALLATVRPRHAAGKARRQLAVDFLDDLVTLDRKIKDINGRIKTAVEAIGTRGT